MKKFILIAALLAPSIAFAEPVDFSIVLLSTDGKPALECTRLSIDRNKCEEEITLTLGWLSRFALDAPEERGQQVPLSEVYKRGSLSEKIRGNDKLDLSVDEAKLIKDQILKLSYRINIKYQAVKLIDPKGAADGK